VRRGERDRLRVFMVQRGNETRHSRRMEDGWEFIAGLAVKSFRPIGTGGVGETMVSRRGETQWRSFRDGTTFSSLRRKTGGAGGLQAGKKNAFFFLRDVAIGGEREVKKEIVRMVDGGVVRLQGTKK